MVSLYSGRNAFASASAVAIFAGLLVRQRISFTRLYGSGSNGGSNSSKDRVGSEACVYSVSTVEKLTHPVVLTGPVTHGFGRGSKLLGCPTANIDYSIVGESLKSTKNGIYFGWARLNSEDPVYGMVTSIGWNPTFNNEQKSIEPHILHDFEEDFYGAKISVVLCGYIRPELSFVSLEALIECIDKDKDIAKMSLESGAYDEMKDILE